MSVIDLSGKKGLVIGIANEQSIAWGCAHIMRQGGAELAITYLNDKAKPHVAPLAERIDAPIVMPLDVTSSEQEDALFEEIANAWGKLDFLIHSIAYAPKDDLHGRVVDSSAAGFGKAMDISCHSLMRLARRAEPLMSDGGSLITMSFYGAEKVVANYGIMGPIKAALESSVEYLAYELGAVNIRANAISPGPVATRAASGLDSFDRLLSEAEKRAPLRRLITPDDVGHLAAFLASDLATNITGGVHYVDSGYEIVAQN